MSELQWIAEYAPTRTVGQSEFALLWFQDLDDERPFEGTGCSLLSAEERSRAERLKSVLARQRFVARCVRVRRLLGSLVGVAPEALAFRCSRTGKPELACDHGAHPEPLAKLRFNLSHSENILALGVSFHGDVGVDVEVVRPEVDVLAIAEVQFTTAEFMSLLSFSPAERVREFYRLWTRREALAKMDGRGIAAPSPAEPTAGASRALYSFEFKLGGKELVGALALGTRPEPVCA